MNFDLIDNFDFEEPSDDELKKIEDELTSSDK